MYKTAKLCSRFVVPVFTVVLLGNCSSAPQKHKTDTVEIKDMKFVPDDITVKKGDTVLWINKDMVAHDVTETTTKAWTSGPIHPDSTWKMAIEGEADYYCSIHLVTKGKVRLEY